ncbi:uncharacterized protein B0J16DRAFT_345615 [Fusarium flagelliforme]|uniref:uncharacterized protein n=1 Tax=Fusarium flagelliforme TaxID=2675880 RepID=UPI001E8EF184|nr:uncharacterized protein B0J16DRAFT_345615 [Fusarium flagelliforme]KAH7183273.1 hypothetical protein B0J16DRAFT_345615 [Fusarium flagelliforme]
MSGDGECPDGDSRGVRELIVKLIIAHLTAVVAFCNLQSLREERLASIEPVIFLFFPFIVIFQTALGLLVIHTTLAISILQKPNFWQQHVRIYARQWSVLLARKPRPERPVEESVGLLTEERRVESRTERAWVKIGRLVVMAGTLFQFVATIFLYKRRLSLHGWDSLSIIDHRTFELAVGGTTVSVMSILLLLKLPGFREAPEVISPATKDMRLKEILRFFRGDPGRCRRWYHIPYLPNAGMETSMATWVLCILSVTYNGQIVFPRYVEISYPFIFELAKSFLPNAHLPSFYFFIVAGFLAALTLGKMAIARVDGYKLKSKTLCGVILEVIGIIIGFCVFCFIMAMTTIFSIGPLFSYFMPVASFGPAWGLLPKVAETYVIFSQPPFRTADNGTDYILWWNDQETECLLLWKDPMADYLWSLF